MRFERPDRSLRIVSAAAILRARWSFRVGRPWGKNAFITGWGARDEQFSPIPREFYYTSTYAGIERQFSDGAQDSVRSANTYDRGALKSAAVRNRPGISSRRQRGVFSHAQLVDTGFNRLFAEYGDPRL